MTNTEFNLDINIEKIPDFPIQVTLAEKTFPLLELNDHSYFRVLRNKLKWG